MIFEPLYSPDLGLVGFRCRCTAEGGRACTRVVRTQRGAEMHCWRKHKVKVQMEIDYEAKASAEPEPVRSERSAKRAAEERDVLAGFAKLKPDSAGRY